MCIFTLLMPIRSLIKPMSKSVREELNNKMVNYYLYKFEGALQYFRLSESQKLIKHPIRTIYNKTLSVILEKIDKSIRIKAKTFWGDRMIIVWKESVSLSIFKVGFFEEGLTRMLLQYLQPKMIFFDIGAHFGYFTMLASRIVGRKGRVYSFEPTKSTYKILSSNSRSLDNIYLNNLAVSSKSGSVVFNDWGTEFSAFNSFYQPRLESRIREKLMLSQYEIQTINLDEYIYRNHVKPDFIKIDAESAEYDILLGMSQILKEIRPIITLEVGDMDLPGVITSRELVIHLINKGYQAYEYNGESIVRHEIRDRYSYDNILFLPL